MFAQNGISLKTQMRVIGKSWGWLWEEKHFDSTLGSTSTVIWTLPLTDSKTNIVLCLVGYTCTMTSSRDTAVRPGKRLTVVKRTCHHVLSKTDCSLEKTAWGCTFHQSFFIKMIFFFFFFVYPGEKKVSAAKLLNLLFLLFKQHTHFHETLCSCYCLFRTSVHRQMSIVYPDKQYLGVSGRVPRWCCDKSIMCWQLCLCYRLVHVLEGCRSALPLSLALGGLKALCP